MDKKIFVETMRDLWGKDFNFSEAWDVYNEMSHDGGEGMPYGNDAARELMQVLPNMDKYERLLWRTQLSEQGYELTPIQVDQYISIIELVMSE